MNVSANPPIPVLSIAGSDPSGGAGIQADLKTFLDHGVYGMAAITALTVQNTTGVVAVHPVAPIIVADQVREILSDMPPAVVKIGMLATEATVHAVADVLEGYEGLLVVDPVLVSSSGLPLLNPSGRRALVTRLLPRATLVTPNLPELELLGEPARFAEEHGVAVLKKDGHGEGRELVDRLYLPGGQTHTWRHPRQRVRNSHGTGCTLASAIAARLARGETLPAAVEGAIGYVAGLLLSSAGHRLGAGCGPLLHGLGRRSQTGG